MEVPLLIADFMLFLTSVVLISLSGVIMPGPLLAVTFERSSQNKTAGPLIAFGHGLIEIPLILIIYLGLTSAANVGAVQIVVGLVGGLIMIFWGVQIYRKKLQTPQETVEDKKHGALLAGAVATGANPYFIIWWITIGTALIINTELFGLVGFAVFIIIHWLCDFFWYTGVGLAVFKSKKFWTKRVQQFILIFSFTVLVGFGIWFFSSALWTIISTLG